MIINESGGSATTTSVQNPGGKDQNLEGAVRTYILAKSGQSFATVAAAKLLTNWDTAKAAKDIVIFYDVEELEDNNTDPIKKEGRYKDYKIKDGIKGVAYTHYLGTHAHIALDSYQNSDYTRVYRITENNELLCEVQDDGSVKGQPLSSFIVGERLDAPADGTPSSKVELKFDAHDMSILKPAFDMSDYEGIYDLKFEQVSASATSIKFKALETFNENVVSSLIDADVDILDAAGAAYTHSFVAADADDEYELTGAAFATGFTIVLTGIVTKSGRDYDSPVALSITVT